MTFKAAPISTRWLPFLIALAVAAALIAPGGSADAQQTSPDLEALNNRLVGLFELNGVVFTDADETTGRLVVGVENKGLTRAVEQRLRVLGVSAEMVDIVETPAIHQLDTLQDQVRPLAGGLQIRFGGYLCTLGFNAVLGGVEGFVTNSHCTDVQGGVEDTSYYQPLTQIASQLVGTEIVDPVYLGSTCSGNIFPVRNRVCRWSDSAFAARESGVAADLGYIQKTTGVNDGSLEIGGRFEIVGETTLRMGDEANKVGRTTGWTQALVSRDCVHTGVSGSKIIQLCQTFVEANYTLVGPGDSGSPVFAIADGKAHLAGLVWGGNSDGTLIVYSPLANIENEMSNTELGPLDTVAGSEPPPSNDAPVVDITSPADAATFTTSDSIVFTGTATDTEDNDSTLNIVWTSDLDDQIGNGGLFSATLSEGIHTITASATDSGALTGTDSITVTVSGDPPVVDITSPTDPATFTTSDSIGFTGTANDNEAGDLNGSIVWTSDLDGQVGTGGSISATLSEGTHTITASATDTAGQTGTDSITVTVNPPEPGSVELTGDSINTRSTWTAVATVTGPDGIYSGYWNGDAADTSSCEITAVDDGSCDILKLGIRKNVSSVTFTLVLPGETKTVVILKP